jgi:hypothetical protein
MQIRLNKLESIVLGWVSMDYESLETISGNVAHDYEGEVSKEELHEVLVGLRSKGLVESFAYLSDERKYVPQAPIGSYPQTDVWWFVTEKGEQILQKF